MDLIEEFEERKHESVLSEERKGEPQDWILPPPLPEARKMDLLDAAGDMAIEDT